MTGKQKNDPRDLGLNLRARGPERVTMTNQGKLGFPAGVERDDKKFMYRWALDDKQGSMQSYIDAYWELMTNSRGEYVARPAGHGKTHYLIRIPKEYWDEDQKKKQDANIDSLQKRAEIRQGEYVPMGHDAVISKSMGG